MSVPKDALLEAVIAELLENLESVADSWKPEPGDVIAGRVVRHEKRMTKRDEEKKVIVLEVPPDGRHVSVWRLHTVLDQELAKAAPEPGDVIVIRYAGTATGKASGNEFHSYTVAVRRAAAVAGEAAEPAGEVKPAGAPEPAADSIPF